MNRVLFLYLNKTTGHHKAAEALKIALEQTDSEAFGTLVDFATQSYPLISTLTSKTYLRILKTTPQIWDYLYDNRNVEEGTRELRAFVNVITAMKLAKFVEEHHPAVLVCTQAFPCIAIAEQKQRGKIRLPLIGVVTDFHAHGYWLHPEVDLYLAASDNTKASMVERGISPEKIAVTGIPIHPDFESAVSKPKARRQLSLHPELPTILVMGGGHGLCPMDKILQALSTLTKPHQIMAVTGANKKLSQRIQKKFSNAHHIFSFNYRPDIARLMDASDILITKAGGLTSSEAMAKGLPMVIVNPLPGQEERNVRFLLKHEAALLVKSLGDLAVTIKGLFQDQEKFQALSSHAKALGRPQAAREAAELILSFIQNKEFHRLTSSRSASESRRSSDIFLH